MNNIKFRIAKPSDAKQIANCHWHVRDRYSQGIFLSLGEGFLRAYYKIILNDPWEVVICAEREDGRIVGFSSATLDGKSQDATLVKHKFQLAFAAAKAIIIHPKLFKECWIRYKSLQKNAVDPDFAGIDGARSDYWCWSKDDDSLCSVEMGEALEHIVYSLGYKEWFFEVDKFNTQVYRYNIKVKKATPIKEFKIPDGRVRVLFKTELKAGK